MAAAYRADLAQLSSVSLGELRVDQLQWLAWVQELCHADENIMLPKEMAACLQPLYAERIKQLRTAVMRQGGLSFLMRTQYLASPETGPAHGQGEHPGFGTLQASWPRADSSEEAWAAWNHTVEERLMKMADASQTGGVDGGKTLAWNDEMASSQDVMLHVRIKTMEHHRVTAGLSMNGMGHGAAHPYETWHTMTWLLDQKRALRAEDVFSPNSDWKQVVAAACWQQLSTNENSKYLYEQVKGPDAKELQQVILDVGNWTLEQDGLHISYPEYAVSPRMAPMDDAVLPWGALRAVLMTGFVAP